MNLKQTNIDIVVLNVWYILDIGKTPKITAINRIANMEAMLPGLTQNDSMVPYCHADGLPQTYDIALDNKPIYHCSHQVPLPKDKVVDILIIDDTANERGITHPFHLHGYGFQVIDMGTHDQLVNKNSAFINAKHPPVIKDTITIISHGYVRLRFRTTNPGYWVCNRLKCFIQMSPFSWHLSHFISFYFI